MNADAWLKKSSYLLEIGGDKTEDSIDKVLSKRKQTLTKGGHLLRSLEVLKTDNNSNSLKLDLIIEWKGVNNSGKPVSAKIHQELKIQIKKDKTWEVIHIKEKHLLPIISPWMGMLC